MPKKTQRTTTTKRTAATKKSTKKAASIQRSALYARIATGALVLLVAVALWASPYLNGKKTGSSDKVVAPAATATAEPVSTLDLQPQAAANTEAARTVQAQVVADSGSDAVNAVQAKVTYPADKLTYEGIQEGTAFPMVLATDNKQPGVVLLARGTNLGSDGIAGQHDVATLSFKVKNGVSGPVAVSIDSSLSMLVRSGDSVNLLGISTGAKLYTNVTEQ